jgi:biopolymer transport protein ExbD
MSMLISGSGEKTEINVTPLIDVLLVLLIIFLILGPPRSKGLEALVPHESHTTAPPKPVEQIMLTVLPHDTVQLNHDQIALAQLPTKLEAAVKTSPDPVLFVRRQKDLNFGQIAAVLDIAKGAGIQRIGILTH